MKPIALLSMILLMILPVSARAQDAALEERLNRLDGQIQNLIEARDAQNRRIDELARRLRELQDQVGKPGTEYASQQELQRLSEKLQEIDRKRQQDSELILKQIETLGRTLSSGNRPVPPRNPDAGAAAPVADKGYEYVVRQGDTLSVIVAAYREQGIRVTVDQILKANPGLDPNRMAVGRKIFIPAPQ